MAKLEFSQMSVIAAVASACAAWLALILSGFNFFTSRQALNLSRHEASKKKPALALYLQEGYLSRNDREKFRLYAFLLSISNQSENDNSVRDLLLQLTYIKKENAFTVKIPASAAETYFARDSKLANRLVAPLRLEALQTILGWCFFRVQSEILDGGVVDRTLVTIVDTHGNELSVEPMMIREYDDAVPAP